MDLELIIEFTFGLIITIAVITSVGGIILLRPVSRHLGSFLEAKVQERRGLERTGLESLEQALRALESMEDRLAAVEKRQEFTEKLLAGPGDG